MRVWFGRGYLAALMVGLLALVLGGERTVAQPCEPQWAEGMFGYPGIDGDVRDAVYFDDGRGEALFVTGEFDVAGAAAATNIARWDGTNWEPLGEGLTRSEPAAGLALKVFDDGRGPALYVGGWFSHAGGVPAANIARWDGSTWEPVGSGIPGSVAELAVFDDGTGLALYASGSFDAAGGQAASRIARWDGSAWSPLGAGLNAGADALVVFDDGTGPALYAGGGFDTAGGVAARWIARWDGSLWSALPRDFAVGGGGVWALEVFDDGRGPALYAAGNFEDALGVGANYVARWDGAAWESLGGGLVNGFAFSMTVHDDGSGPGLYVGGGFLSAGGVPARQIARWDGSDWSSVGEGTSGAGSGIRRMLPTPDGSALLALGGFSRTGDQYAFSIVRWDGSTLAPVTPGLAERVYTMTDATIDGRRSNYAGGGQGLLVRWDGAAWTPIEEPVDDTVFALFEHDDGSGPSLFAGGRFETAGGVTVNRVARWDGSQWHALGSGLGSRDTTPVYDMAVFDDGRGPALYAGGALGAFTVGRWDGSQWEVAFSPMERRSGSSSATVHALAVFDDGSGPALYAGGTFVSVDGVPANNIARWDGTEWTPLGEGTSTDVFALATFDDGSGEALYAAGRFASVGGEPFNRIARWDGTEWTPLGTGFDDWVYALAVFDDGTGASLYAGGVFGMVDGVPAERMARWDGTRWWSLDGGPNDRVQDLTVLEDDLGVGLYVGGRFTEVGGTPSVLVARWGCEHACRPDIDGDGALTIFDFLGYQNLFDAGDLAADFDGDGSLTIFDFLAFQNAFDAGCD